ncbi:uncharacterized protein IUM83_06535 [Phytophthora cinnamomi]|uniref:uncharacterized protein n=1 Tax=Phytophthora cinnamomi TaxID=4785 RepID=UPI0035593878|nr:hypothetical protein IUM83_06535 [Phytophthora cinnamomi]
MYHYDETMTLAEVVTTPEAADDAAPSVANGETDQPRPRRKRKATGTRRREEIEALEQEVKALQAQVADLQKKADAEAAAKAEIKRSEMEQEMQDTGFIRLAVLQQQASLVNVQSALSRLTPCYAVDDRAWSSTRD